MAERTGSDVKNATSLRAIGIGMALTLGLTAGFVQPTPAKALFEGSLFSPSGNYLAGRLAGKNRDNAQAAEFYGRTLRTDPDNNIILERTFLLELSAGNIEQAEGLAKRVVNQDARNRLARIVLGLRDFKAKRYEAARANWKSAALGSIGKLTSAMLTAWSYAAQNKTDEAISALDDLANTESFAIYRIFHGALIADLGRDEERAKEFYEKAYESAGSSLRVVQAYGNYLQRRGETDKAREIYQTYAKSTNEHPLILDVIKGIDDGRDVAAMIPDARTGAAESLFGLASALADESGVDFAIVYSNLTLDLKADFPIAATLLGDIYEDAKLYEQAINTYRAVPGNSPLQLNARIQTALNLNDLERLDEARAVLDAVIEENPNRYQPKFTMANILRGHSEFAEAAEYYSKAIDLLDKIEERHWTVFYFRGICYERSKQWHKAEADFLKALDLHPDQPLVLNYLGYSWIEKRHNLDEAIKMIRKAVELRPNDGYIVDSLGWAYYQMKDYDQAVKELERAVELRPEDPVINDHLGDAYWMVGRRIEAVFQWTHARDFKPEPEYLERILLKLEHGLLDGKAENETDQPDKS